MLGKIISSDKTLAAHVASDEAIFQRLFEGMKDLKEDLKAQGAKLDRLIEQNLNRTSDAMVVQAMALMTHAAAEAKKAANNV